MIKCKSLIKTFENLNAVDNVSFEIKDGSFIGLLGPNGAGKTTLLKVMIGLLDPTNGYISYDDIVINKDTIEIKKRIGVVSQHINLDKELSIYENMVFSSKLYKMKKRDYEPRIEYLLKVLGLYEIKDKAIKKLSGGMKRKLMIGKAIIHDPDFIFLDEPTIGIDVSARKEIWKFLREYHRSGKTIILTTHYIEEAEKLCESVMLMSDGKIFKENTPLNLIEEIGVYKVGFDEFRFCFFNSLNEAKEYVKNIEEIYTISKTTLEDVFYHYTSKKVHIWK
jgi:ABC-2 type transport system ATP-binding protein